MTPIAALQRPIAPFLLLFAFLTAGAFAAQDEAKGAAPPVDHPAASSGKRVYRTVDAEGNPVFTDQPVEGAEEVELGKTIIYSPEAIKQPDRPIDPRTAKSSGAPAYTYSSLAILAPKPDEVIRNNAGNLTVKGTFAPALRPDHEIQLLIDGAVYASGNSAEFELEHVDRGVHVLQLQIVDTLSSQVLMQSEPVTMTLMRFSILNPGAKSR